MSKDVHSHSAYVHTCMLYRFVDEVRHEWGERVSGGGGEIHPLEAAPRRWRQTLADTSGGAFKGWKVSSSMLAKHYSAYYIAIEIHLPPTPSVHSAPVLIAHNVDYIYM